MTKQIRDQQVKLYYALKANKTKKVKKHISKLFDTVEEYIDNNLSYEHEINERNEVINLIHQGLVKEVVETAYETAYETENETEVMILV